MKALYFGCYNSVGHYLYDTEGNQVWDFPSSFPWSLELMDSGLLINGKVPDITDGRVYWTCGGRSEVWYAFYWWDRSIDTRGACNSGFYVNGFEVNNPKSAFEFACSQFTSIISRQKYPLVLQEQK